jgi:FkbM family methyltransferase
MSTHTPHAFHEPRPVQPFIQGTAYKAMAYGARKLSLPGRGRLASLLLKYPARIAYTDANGHKRLTDLRDILGARLLLGLGGMPPFVAAKVAPGSTVVDAGANIGLITGQLRKAVGPAGHVIAIEPLPANVAALDEFRVDNSFDNLEIVAAALADREGTVSLRLSRDDETATSPYASITASWINAGEITVPTVALDDIVGDRRVDFIKLDVEGAEALALRGATRVLERDRPLVYCEFNDIIHRDVGSSSAGLLAEFAEHGYRPVREHRETAARLDGVVTDLVLTK